MDTFRFARTSTVAEAVQSGGVDACYVAGGTTLIDLMKLNVERPRRVIDINKLPLSEVEKGADGSLRIGALVRNSDLAHHPAVRQDYAVLSEALLSGASAQLRNMATTGGNLLQRTRCVYFRDISYSACNKRVPRSGCSAIGGYNRMLAILGTTLHCHQSLRHGRRHDGSRSRNPLAGAAGKSGRPHRRVYTLPGDTPHIETVLRPGELITHVTLPAPLPNTRSVYLKLRDRASYEFALTSAAVVASVHSGSVRHVHIAMGGVGTRPWRSFEAERALEGKPATPEHFAAAASIFLAVARPQSENAFKVELAKRCLIRALGMATSAA